MSEATRHEKNLLRDEKKAQRILKNRDFDRFDDVATVEFWASLARLLAQALDRRIKGHAK